MWLIFLKVFSCTQSGPQHAENHMLQLSNFKIFQGSMLPDPHRKGGLTQGLLVDKVNCYISNLLVNYFY